jgi:phage terminase small subunit
MAKKPTIKQQRALTNLLADGGSKASAMIKAGYSPRTARDPSKLFDSPVMKPVIDKLAQQLEDERQEVLDRMKATRSRAKYRDLTYALDIVTKNYQLVTGGRTENGGIEELATSINNWIKSSKND